MQRLLKKCLMLTCAAAIALPLLAWGHGPAEDRGKEIEGHGGEAMTAQHERMRHFKEAMELLPDAIIRGDAKTAGEGAEKLARSIQGHEKDVPHKNRARRKEFHGLYVELGKRTGNLRAAIRANDLPRAGAAYGKVLETCAACHRTFRD
ncbi:MAG: cytochrome c [Deltaproteobacteria bacterium]|nr:cytochrome c [Deltaproteobacteria bacterium]